MVEIGLDVQNRCGVVVQVRVDIDMSGKHYPNGKCEKSVTHTMGAVFKNENKILKTKACRCSTAECAWFKNT